MPASCFIHKNLPVFLLSLMMVLLFGCASSSTKLIHWDHPLTGKIWDVKQQTFISQEQLVGRILDSEYLLLGERHDNMVHHEQQAWAIRKLAEARRQASVAFEMIDNYQGKRIARQKIDSVDQLIDILNVFKTGWKYEQRYKELFAEVLAAGYRIDSANLNRKRLMHTVMQGEGKLPDDYKAMLEQAPLTAEQTKILHQEINLSHCNMLDEHSVRKMSLGQRVRDVIMAQSLIKSDEPMKVLIAGNGHILNDRAVPLYLRAHLKQQSKFADILTVSMIEVESDHMDVATYAHHWGGNSIPFDIVWFTPQVKREKNQCDQLRKHFEKIKQQKKQP